MKCFIEEACNLYDSSIKASVDIPKTKKNNEK